MATKSARNQVLYAGATNASPIAEGRGFRITSPTDLLEDTAWGDDVKTYIPGLSDFRAALTKWYDDAAFVIEAAATGRTLLKFYWYADRDATGDYWYWSGYVTSLQQGGDITALVDESYDIVASGAVSHKHA
jgi:hypothetical protein